MQPVYSYLNYIIEVLLPQQNYDIKQYKAELSIS